MFYNFPIELQIEILKYLPFFRRINKEFYKQGEYVFKQLYGDLPISKNEFIKYQTHFSGTIFSHHDHILYANYLRPNNDAYCIKLHHNPYYIDPRYYCKSITYYKGFPCPVYHNYALLQKNLKYQKKIFYDFKSTFDILEQRQCFKIDYVFKKNYLDLLFTSNGSDFDNLNTKLKYILYLTPYDVMMDLDIQLTFLNEKVLAEDKDRYLMILQELDKIYQYYYNHALS